MDAPSSLPGSHDLCIIGAGVSGLCLARLAAGKGLRVLLLERGGEAGGCLSTAPVGSGGWLELGAHTCYNSYRQFMDIMDGTGFLDRATPRKGLSFRMIERGALRSIPSCLNFLEAALHLPRMFGAAKAGQSAEAYYSRILGPGNWARVLHPALNAVASQETRNFPADALFQARPGRRKEVVRSFAVRGGLGPAVRALAGFPGIRCVPGQEAVELAKTAEGFQVRTAQGETFQAARVALAAPAPAGARLLAGLYPEVARLLGRIETRTVRSLGVVFRDPLAHLPRLAGLILPEGPCFSAVSGDAFPVAGMRAWTFHFDGARSGGPEDMLDHACRVLSAPRAAVAESHLREHTMPAIAVGHAQWVQELDRSLAGTGLMVVGNYLAGLAIEDCAGRARQEFQRVVGG